MATRLYPHEQAPGYSPGATYKGGWEDTSATITRAAGPERPDFRKPYATANASKAETSTSGTYDVCLMRLVSPPLASNVTIAGTLTIVARVYESAAAADHIAYCHVWVSQGDSTTLRGTLLNNWTGAEFGTSTSVYTAMLNAVALTSTACTAGDRIIIELGYRATNTVATSYTSTIRIDGSEQLPDAYVGLAASDEAANAPWFEFSDTFSFASTVRVTQFNVETAIQDSGSPTARLSQVVTEVALIPIPPARLSQDVIEVVLPSPPKLSQMVIEVVVLPPATGGMVNACDVALLLSNLAGDLVDISGSSNYAAVEATTELGSARTFGSRFPIRAQGVNESAMTLRVLYTTAADEGVALLKDWYFDSPGYRRLRVQIPGSTPPYDQYTFTVRLTKLALTLSAEEPGPVMVEAELRSSHTFTVTRVAA